MPENSTYDKDKYDGNVNNREWNWNELKAHDRKYRKRVATSGKDDDSYYGYDG